MSSASGDCCMAMSCLASRLLGAVGRDDSKQAGFSDGLCAWPCRSGPLRPGGVAPAAEPSFGASGSRAQPWPPEEGPGGRPSQAASTLFELLRREQHSLEYLSPALKEELWRRLDCIREGDLGVRRLDVQRLCGRSGIGYQEVYSAPEMTLCVFVLRAGAHIPLHDHPDMHVFGRLLFGRMRVVSFDAEPASPEGQGSGGAWGSGAKWAYLRSDSVLGPSPVTYGLGPNEGNLHELHALEDCAFFDVVVPPYDASAGRNCTYYAPAPKSIGRHPEDSADSGAGKCLLVPTAPHGFFTETLKYAGPPFSSVQGTLA